MHTIVDKFIKKHKNEISHNIPHDASKSINKNEYWILFKDIYCEYNICIDIKHIMILSVYLSI